MEQEESSPHYGKNPMRIRSALQLEPRVFREDMPPVMLPVCFKPGFEWIASKDTKCFEWINGRNVECHVLVEDDEIIHGAMVLYSRRSSDGLAPHQHPELYASLGEVVRRGELQAAMAASQIEECGIPGLQKYRIPMIATSSGLITRHAQVKRYAYSQWTDGPMDVDAMQIWLYEDLTSKFYKDGKMPQGLGFYHPKYRVWARVMTSDMTLYRLENAPWETFSTDQKEAEMIRGKAMSLQPFREYMKKWWENSNQLTHSEKLHKQLRSVPLQKA